MGFRLNITQKFIGFLFLTSVIPLLGVGIRSYQVSHQILKGEKIKYTTQLVANQKDYLDLQLQQIESLINSISGVTEIVEALDKSDPTIDPYNSLATKARIGYILNSYINLEGLLSIDISTLNNVNYHVGDTLNFSKIRTDVRNRLFEQVEQAGDRIVWAGIEDNINANSNAQKVITAASSLRTVNSQTLQSEPVGLLLVNYNVDYLYKHFSQIDLGEGGYLLVIDAKNRIIYHPDKNLSGTAINPQLVKLLNAERGSFVESINGQDTLVTYDRSRISNWVVLSLIPIHSLLSGTVVIGAATSFALFVSFIIVIIAAWIISRKIVKPVRQITDHFKRCQDGTLEWSEELKLSIPGNDEIAELSRWFNAFLDSLAIRQHIEEALRDSEERYSLALQGANDGIWDWDLRSNIVHYSTRWKTMLGYAEEQIQDSPEEWFQRIHADDLARVQAELAAHLAGQIPHFESEHRMLRGDDQTYCWVLARGLAIRDKDQHASRIAGSLTDITARKMTEDRLRYEAMHDALTRLPNRAYFMNQLNRILAQVHEPCNPVAVVLFLDLDRFKIINDSLGHVAGDQLLIHVAEQLRACVRTGDFVARFGGDEFAILASNLLNVDAAVEIANRIQQQLIHPLNLVDHEISVSVSIGIALISDRYKHAEDLLRDADTALYQAKADGRAGYAIFNETMHMQTLGMLRLETSLRRAIERQELCVYYQPIVCLKNRQIKALEALVRWQHPEQGLVSPAEFIPLAEETGLIVSIGEWVLRKACQQARVWYEQGHTSFTLSVNLSIRQLQDPNLPELIRTILLNAELPAELLQLEITESAAMADVNLTRQILEALRSMGVQIAIDDFGTSYSSLGYLKRFPVSTIKVDKSFVQDIDSDNDAAHIISAIIAMSHALGLRVVAEGVETEAQAAFLKEQQCDAIQGFLISRPLPAEEIWQQTVPTEIVRVDQFSSLL